MLHCMPDDKFMYLVIMTCKGDLKVTFEIFISFWMGPYSRGGRSGNQRKKM